MCQKDGWGVLYFIRFPDKSMWELGLCVLKQNKSEIFWFHCVVRLP